MRPTDVLTSVDPVTVSLDARPTDASDPAPPGHDPLPAAVGGFRVERVLGRGGMGVVYAAHDPHLGRPVAVKVMRADWAGGAVHRERFLREARAAGGLHHDHIVPVYQAGEAGGEPFLVMPLLSGRTLDARLKAGPVPLAEAVEVGRQAALGLAAAHAAGLVHRDVKPANLFLEDLSGGGVRVRLLDFGLVQSAAEEPGLTNPGAVMGTPAYMAPEQVWGQPADHRADLFALGCVLYHLATGVPPFAGTDPSAARSRLDPAALPPARVVNPAVPAELSGLVGRLMATQPADRPASAGGVAAELRQVAAALGRPPRRPRWPRVAVAAGLLGLGGLVLAQVVIRLEKDGKTTELTVPDGSRVVVNASGPVTVQVPPAAPPPAAQTPPTAPKSAEPATASAGFDVLVDADLAGLRRWLGEMRRRGLRPDALSVRGVDEGRFTAVAVADGLPWHGMTPDDPAVWKPEAARLNADGYRPVAHVARMGAAGEGVPVTLWAGAGGPSPWVARRLPTEAALKSLLDKEADRRMWPVRLCGVRFPGLTQYSVVMAENPRALLYWWRVDASPAQLDAQHRSRTAAGYRLHALDSSDGPDGPLFHAVWIKDGGTSDFTLDLTREQLDRQLAQRLAARSRPHTLSAYDVPGGLRFAVTWVPMGLAPASEPAPPPRPAG